jgi:hypothetical protein
MPVAELLLNVHLVNVGLLPSLLNIPAPPLAELLLKLQSVNVGLLS